MRHAELELGVVSAPVRRVEGKEFGELVDREDEGFRRPFADVGVADPELRVGTIRARRIRLGDLLEKLARRQPLPGIERVCALVEEELVGLGRASRHAAAGARRAGCGSDQGRDGEGPPKAQP